MGERIVLGLGNNIDFETVWNPGPIERLIIEYNVKPGEIGTEGPIANVRDFVVSVLGFLKSGTGGERLLASQELAYQLAGMFEGKITVGGTPFRAAIAMHKIGYTPGLHLVTMNHHVRRSIPDGCPWVCSNDENGIHPHIIVQFAKHSRIQAGDVSVEANRANRIIYSNDPHTTDMNISPRLASLAADAEVFLISGFNAMQSGKLLAARLATIAEVVRSLRPGAVAFYEDGCFPLPELSIQVRDALSKFIHIHSLNEDELQGHLNRNIPLLDPFEILRALQDLRKLIPVPTIVVHTAQWALAYGANPDRYATSLKAGIHMACTRMRRGDDFDQLDYIETQRMLPRTDGLKFAAELTKLAKGLVCCYPSIQIDEAAATTIGLGDAFVGGFLPMILPASIQTFP